MKKNEDAAAKKKPKTSAAQIRVQKGMSYSSIDIAFGA
jgi:ubiquitin-conjugating enzyme E2 M